MHIEKSKFRIRREENSRKSRTVTETSIQAAMETMEDLNLNNFIWKRTHNQKLNSIQDKISGNGTFYTASPAPPRFTQLSIPSMDT